MKKFVKILGLIASLGLALTMFSCNNDAVGIKDIELDDPVIEVKAFPGYNYVAWEPVLDAEGMMVVRNDGKIIEKKANTVLYAIDADVQDKIKYTYTVYATPTGDNLKDNTLFPGHDTMEGAWDDEFGVTFKGSKASASVTAIVPPAGTRALDLITYVNSKDKDFVLDANKIKVEVIKNQIWVMFPVKGYLDYTVKLYKGNELEVFDKLESIPEVWSGKDDIGGQYGESTDTYNNNSKNFYSIDYQYAGKFNVVDAGEYSVTVDVSVNDQLSNLNKYPDSDTIYAATKAEIKGLDVLYPTSAYAVYKDAKTIRILWQPAYNHNMEAYLPENYNVYYRNNFTNYWTEVSATTVKKAKVDEEGNQILDAETGEPVMEDVPASLIKDEGVIGGYVAYYMDFDLEANKVSNEIYNNFRVVLSKDGLYEYTDYNDDYDDIHNQVILNPFVTTPEELDGDDFAINYVALDGDGIANDALITINIPADMNGKVKIDSAAWALQDTYNYVLFDGDFTNPLTIIDPIGNNTFVLKDVAQGKFLAVQAVISEEGKSAVRYQRKVCSATPGVVPSSKVTSVDATKATVAFADVDDDLNLDKKDVYFKITLANDNQKVVKAKYAVGKTSEIATSMLYSDKTTEITFNQLETTAFAYVKDIDKNLFVAMYAEVEEEGLGNATIVKATTESSGLISLADNTIKPTVEVGYYDADNDGIVNDAIVYVEVADGVTLDEVKYTTSLDNTIGDLLLTTDLAKTLDIPEAKQYGYIWTIKDVEKDMFVNVYAKVSKDPKWSSAKVSTNANTQNKTAKSEDEGYDSSIKDKLTIKFITLDDDQLQNDVLITVEIDDDKDSVLTAVKFGTSFVSDSAMIFAGDAKSLIIPTTTATATKRQYFYFIEKDVEEGKYAIAYAEVKNKKQYNFVTAITNDGDPSDPAPVAVGQLEDAEIGTVTGSFVDKDDNGKADDLQLNVVLPADYGKNAYELKQLLYLIVPEDTYEYKANLALGDLILSPSVQKIDVDPKTYTYFVKDVPNKAKVVWTAEVGVVGKADVFGVNGTTKGSSRNATCDISAYLTTANNTIIWNPQDITTRVLLDGQIKYNAGLDYTQAASYGDWDETYEVAKTIYDNGYNDEIEGLFGIYNGDTTDKHVNDLAPFTVRVSAKQKIASIEWTFDDTQKGALQLLRRDSKVTKIEESRLTPKAETLVSYTTDNTDPQNPVITQDAEKKDSKAKIYEIKDLIKDVEYGKYIALRITVSEENKESQVYEFVTTNKSEKAK